MNCYDYRKKITGSMSVEFSLQFYGGPEFPLTISGSHTFVNKPLKTDLTRKEVACGPVELVNQSVVLRSLDLCEGRATLDGVLNTDQMTVTYSYEGEEPYTTLESLSLWTKSNEEGALWECNTLGTTLPMGVAYPDWSDDPYSVATRNRIDQIVAAGEKTIYFDIGNGGSTSFEPPDAPGFKWPLSGSTDTFTGNGWTKSCTITYNFAVV